MKLNDRGLLFITSICLAGAVGIGALVFVIYSFLIPENAAIAVILCMIAASFILSGAAFLSYRIYHSVYSWNFDDMIKKMQAVSQGNFPDPIQIENDDPLKELKIPFQKITEKLKEYALKFDESVEKKAGDVKKNAELAVLQNQLLQENRIELEKYKRAVAEAPVHIIITDPEGKIVYANQAASKITGYSVAEMIGKTPALWGKKMPPEFYQKMWQAIKAERRAFRGELTNKRKNGMSYEAEIRIEPVLDHENQVQFYVGIEEDVTHKKQVDRMKTEFISLASHQLRTPLTAIRWTVEEMLGNKDHQLGEYHLEAVRKVYGSTLRMVELVKTLLNISRIESGRISVIPGRVRVYPLIMNAVNELKPKLDEKNQNVITAIDPESLEITTDENLFLNVIMNLLSNASKYSPDGGVITVKCKLENDIMHAEVKDAGIGIPDADKARIFERFFRAGNVALGNEEGTGLGLYLVKQIVNLLSGEIKFESTEGAGSTFFVSLPAAGPNEKQGEVSIS